MAEERVSPEGLMRLVGNVLDSLAENKYEDALRSLGSLQRAVEQAPDYDQAVFGRE